MARSTDGMSPVRGRSSSSSKPNSSSSPSKTRSGRKTRSSTSHVTYEKGRPGGARRIRAVPWRGSARAGGRTRTSPGRTSHRRTASQPRATLPVNRSRDPSPAASISRSTVSTISRDASRPVTRIPGQRQRRPCQVPRPDPDVEDLDRSALDGWRELIQQGPSARCKDRATSAHNRRRSRRSDAPPRRPWPARSRPHRAMTESSGRRVVGPARRRAPSLAGGGRVSRAAADADRRVGAGRTPPAR